jgi:IS5 family transposase
MVKATVRPGGTVGADKGYDQRPFVEALRAVGVTRHVASKAACGAIDGRTTRHPGYAVSQRKRKLVEQVYGWMKTVGGLRQVKHRGGRLVDWQVTFAAAAYNLVRLRTLGVAPV